MVLLDCSVFSFLLHAAESSNAHSASVLTNIILHPVFLFMMSSFLESLKIVENRLFYREPPFAAACDSVAACLRTVGGRTLAAFAWGMEAATFRCSSGVSWKM